MCTVTTATTTSATNDSKVYHHYEEIDDMAAVFLKDTTKTETTTFPALPPDQPVRLRSESGNTPENMKQKLYRRLSFNKDKLKHSANFDKTRGGAKDDSFVDIKMPNPIGEENKRNSTQKSNISINVPPQQSKNTFVGFFHALQRKGSKRDLTAKCKLFIYSLILMVFHSNLVTNF